MTHIFVTEVSTVFDARCNEKNSYDTLFKAQLEAQKHQDRMLEVLGEKSCHLLVRGAIKQNGRNFLFSIVKMSQDFLKKEN